MAYHAGVNPSIGTISSNSPTRADPGLMNAPRRMFHFAFGIAQGVLHPVASVVSDVSQYYANKMYRYMLSNRDLEQHYKQLMEKANCYEQWAAAGFMLDRCQGKDKWKAHNKSSHYDYGLVSDRLDSLRLSRKEGNVLAMMFNLRTTISRNLGEMGNPELYEYTNVGTKVLIEDYNEELMKQFDYIADFDTPLVSTEQKIEFFEENRKAYGRTALLLSGGGTFGLTHVGTAKTLYEMKLLPRIISGSSAGAIVASVLGTRTDAELQYILEPKNINLVEITNKNVFENPCDYAFRFDVTSKISRCLKHGRPNSLGVLLDVENLINAMRQNCGNYTFQEAYKRTRRILNITVSSSTRYEMPRLLNYLTSPNVLIWSAVAASCAIPIIYRSAPLMAKDKHGGEVLWNPSGYKYEDGSIEGDLPMQRLSELFGVNHFLVAQVNPHLLPFLKTDEGRTGFLKKMAVNLAWGVESELQHRLFQILDFGASWSLLHKLHSVMLQTYLGHITITPKISFLRYFYILANPTVEMVEDYMVDGEHATWKSIIFFDLEIAILRNHCLIEQCIERNLYSLREKHINALHTRAPLKIDTVPSVTAAQPELGGQTSKTTVFVIGHDSSDDGEITNGTTIVAESYAFAKQSVAMLNDTEIRTFASAGDVRKINCHKLLPRSPTQSLISNLC